MYGKKSETRTPFWYVGALALRAYIVKNRETAGWCLFPLLMIASNGRIPIYDANIESESQSLLADTAMNNLSHIPVPALL